MNKLLILIEQKLKKLGFEVREITVPVQFTIRVYTNSESLEIKYGKHALTCFLRDNEFWVQDGGIDEVIGDIKYKIYRTNQDPDIIEISDPEFDPINIFINAFIKQVDKKIALCDEQIHTYKSSKKRLTQSRGFLEQMSRREK